MLSTYFYARRMQELEKEKQAAEIARLEAEKGQQEEARLSARTRLRQQAEDEVRRLNAQLEQATASRHNRRRLRNDASE